MNGVLADSVILLWAGGHAERLTPAVQAAMEKGPCWVSVVSYWEVALKNATGKIEIGAVQDWWQETVARLSARVLPLQAVHVNVIASLPLLHRDPFDRALIAQAIAEDLILLSPERAMARYTDAGLQLLR